MIEVPLVMIVNCKFEELDGENELVSTELFRYNRRNRLSFCLFLIEDVIGI